MNIIKQYDGTDITFNGDGWFNATEVAERFGKRPAHFLELESTKGYIAALQRKYGEIPYFKTRRGGNVGIPGIAGTWLHPKLGVKFARWCDEDFEVWADEQIDQILRGTIDIKRVRHEAAATYKVVSAILQQTREQEGKATAPHHYANEAKLINWVLTGAFQSVDRDALSIHDLDLLAKLEARDAVLIGRGYTYEQRKAALVAYADDLRTSNTMQLVAA